jgi:uncharacterized protein (TIGR03086 family)
MSINELMGQAATELVTVARRVGPEQLGAPTPCREYAVKDLINHLVWVLGGADPAERDRDHTQGDWVGLIAERCDKAVATTWEGTVRLGSHETPAELASSLLLCDLVIHGWDLARATGQPFHCADEPAEAAYRTVTMMAERGRTMGAFGEAVEVPDSAPTLDRALGLSGRDPGWAANTR